LVSEVMLQQTQASRVAPAFVAFVFRFPTIHSLAAASKAEVLRAWAGLGYNRRALNLSEAARVVDSQNKGTIPPNPEALMRLSGEMCAVQCPDATCVHSDSGVASGRTGNVRPRTSDLSRHSLAPFARFGAR